jgi:hypothetical protein
MFEYREGIIPYFKVSLYHILPAIILGAMCQRFCAYIQERYNLNSLAAIIFQLIVMVFILYIIEIRVSMLYGSQWQSITPGLFFVSLFFGLQTSLYNNIANIY